MLEASDTQTLDTAPTQDSAQVLGDRIERLQAELKFSQTRIEALNFEIARLKRWRFVSVRQTTSLHRRRRRGEGVIYAATSLTTGPATGGVGACQRCGSN